MRLLRMPFRCGSAYARHAHRNAQLAFGQTAVRIIHEYRNYREGSIIILRERLEERRRSRNTIVIDFWNELLVRE